MEATRNEIRANLFLAAAEELARIDEPSNEKPVLGRITVCSDALRKVIGKSWRDLNRKDERLKEMLQSATAEGLNLRVRNVVHLFELLNRLADDLSIPCAARKSERQKGEALFRRIHAKLANGYAGCDI
jgi:hypothetical protein